MNFGGELIHRLRSSCRFPLVCFKNKRVRVSQGNDYSRRICGSPFSTTTIAKAFPSPRSLPENCHSLCHHHAARHQDLPCSARSLDQPLAHLESVLFSMPNNYTNGLHVSLCSSFCLFPLDSSSLVEYEDASSSFCRLSVMIVVRPTAVIEHQIA